MPKILGIEGNSGSPKFWVNLPGIPRWSHQEEPPEDTMEGPWEPPGVPRGAGPSKMEIRSHQSPPEPIRAHQIAPHLIRLYPSPPDPIRSHQIPSGPTRSHQSPSNPIRLHQTLSGPIRSHQIHPGHLWRSLIRHLLGFIPNSSLVFWFRMRLSSEVPAHPNHSIIP